MKSNVSDFLELVSTVYIDACSQCPADVSDLRDLTTIRSRVEHEGLSFLTITLPNFCKGVELALKSGYIDPTWRSTHFRGFPFHGAIPAFLQGMLGHLFDIETGRIHNEKTISRRDLATFVDSIRQICLLFKKVELPCTLERESHAISNFIATEHYLSTSSIPKEDTAYFKSVSSVLWDNLVYRFRDCRMVPKHGPGATAERISGNQKYVWQRWHHRLDNFFHFFDMAYSSRAYLSHGVEGVEVVPEEQEQPVRVTLVPKTLKGPRIIAIEPVCMQYAQQGIRSIIYDAIESYWLTSGHINFRDQSINQSLAMNASSTGRYATIDLSDASDRVPRELALEMFRSYPEFRDTIDACRSQGAELPDGTVIRPLMKFASMGSALCFPIEAMYFYTICVGSLLKLRNLPVTYRNVFKVSRRIYVYGDDIIVPTYAADAVLDGLQKYHCKPNVDKTFTTGRFRESCGTDAYYGFPVNPVYVRRTRPKNRRQPANIVSWSATANLFFKKGYLRTAELMHSVCERILKFYPQVSENDAALGRIYPLAGHRGVYRHGHRLQRREVKAFVASPVYRADELDGYAALQKSLLMLESSDSSPGVNLLQLARGNFEVLSLSSDKLHLKRSALHGAVTLKLRWVVAH